ncbi:hypothetical protein BN1013_02267 [Candidatus Rubidus massiliensis]|nr:hypothetical protein BN1013_02267 [Candidatus Rubidus massiliensis]
MISNNINVKTGDNVTQPRNPSPSIEQNNYQKKIQETKTSTTATLTDKKISLSDETQRNLVKKVLEEIFKLLKDSKLFTLDPKTLSNQTIGQVINLIILILINEKVKDDKNKSLEVVENVLTDLAKLIQFDPNKNEEKRLDNPAALIAFLGKDKPETKYILLLLRQKAVFSNSFKDIYQLKSISESQDQLFSFCKNLLQSLLVHFGTINEKVSQKLQLHQNNLKKNKKLLKDYCSGSLASSVEAQAQKYISILNHYLIMLRTAKKEFIFPLSALLGNPHTYGEQKQIQYFLKRSETFSDQISTSIDKFHKQLDKTLLTIDVYTEGQVPAIYYNKSLENSKSILEFRKKILAGVIEFIENRDINSSEMQKINDNFSDDFKFLLKLLKYNPKDIEDQLKTYCKKREYSDVIYRIYWTFYIGANAIIIESEKVQYSLENDFLDCETFFIKERTDLRESECALYQVMYENFQTDLEGFHLSSFLTFYLESSNLITDKDLLNNSFQQHQNTLKNLSIEVSDQLINAKKFYTSLKNITNCLKNNYLVFINSFMHMIPTTFENSTTQLSDPGLEWLEQIDRETTKIIKQKTPNNAPNRNKVSSNVVLPKGNDEEEFEKSMQIVDLGIEIKNTPEWHFDHFVSSIRSHYKIPFFQLLQLDEQLHARHLLWEIDLLALQTPNDRKQNVLLCSLLSHMYHCLEQFYSRKFSNYELNHGLQTITGKKDVILAKIEMATIWHRYPNTSNKKVKEEQITPVGLRLMLHPSVNETLVLLKELLLKRIQEKIEQKLEEKALLLIYEQCLKKLSDFEKNIITTTEVNKDFSNELLHSSSTIQSIKNVIVQLRQFFHVMEEVSELHQLKADLQVHLARLEESIDLLTTYPQQKFWSSHERNISFSLQYIAEHIGLIQTQLKGVELFTHDLENFCDWLNWREILTSKEIDELISLNFHKSIEYFYGDVARHPLRNHTHLLNLEEMYSASVAANVAGEGFVSSEKTKGYSPKILKNFLTRIEQKLNVLYKLALSSTPKPSEK